MKEDYIKMNKIAAYAILRIKERWTKCFDFMFFIQVVFSISVIFE